MSSNWHKNQTASMLVVVSLLLGGCGSGGGSESPASVDLQFRERGLQVSPTSIGQQTQIVVLDNVGSVSSSFEITTNGASWISVSPSAGVLAAGESATLTLNLSCTQPGLRVESLEVSDGSATTLDVIDIEVTCDLPPTPAISEVAPATIQLSALVNGTASSGFGFSNEGGANLSYTVASQSNWISLDPEQGTLAPGGSASVELTGQCASAPSQEVGTVVVSSNDPDDAVISVNVTLDCDSASLPSMGALQPQRFDTSLLVNATAASTFSFANDGEGVLTYELSSEQSWITIVSNLTGSTNPEAVTVVEFTAACAGTEATRNGSINVVTNDPAQSQVSFPVALQCSLPEEADISAFIPESVALDAQLEDSAAGSFQFTNLGGAELGYAITTSDTWIDVTSPLTGQLTSNQSTTVHFTATCDDSVTTRNGNVAVTSNDLNQPTQVLPVALSCGGLANLSLGRVYFSQSVPAADSDVAPSDRIPLVADRPALARAFVSGSESNLSPEVSLVLRTAGGDETTFTLSGPGAAPENPDEGEISDTFNALLSEGELIPGMSFYVEVDPDNLINESDESDNRYPVSGFEPLDVQQLATFKVQFVPIELNGQAPDPIDALSYLKDTLEIFPVGQIDAEVRSAPLIINGSYTSPCDVLDDVSVLRASDGATGSGIFYYAIIQRGPGGGYVGCAYTPGYVGASVSASDIGLSAARITVAHEIGHNFSLLHAPCGGPARTDPDFPYSDGSIGVWGYNVFTGETHSPNGFVKDLMTYCGPNWVSDYGFEKALDHRRAWGARVLASSIATRSLLVGGSVQGDQVTINTVIEVDQPPQMPQPGSYELVVHDQSASEPMRVSFTTKAIDHDSAEHFLMRIPIPVDPLTLMQVEREGQLLNEARPRILAASLGLGSEPVVASLEADGRVKVEWDNRSYQMAIIRDGVDGEIISVDRSGAVRFRPSGGVIAVMLSDGLNSTRTVVAVPR